MHSRVQFLSTAESIQGLPSACLEAAGGTPAPAACKSRKLNSGSVYVALILLLAVLLVNLF